jgi:ABC-type multidrug transport system ATPase subunit
MTAVIPSSADHVRLPPGPAPGLGAPAIDAAAVVQRFGAKVALDDVSLAVPAGSVHALLGPNGAGKTTLIRVLSGLLVPTGGSVRIDGVEVSATRAFRRRVGLVPSGDRSFYLRISGRENLLFFARLHGYGRREALERAERALEDVGLAEAARTRVGFYSHGMQKRLSVARALLADPPILLVDEATHDLDPEGARRVRDLVVAAARRGAAVVWATQRLDEIRGLADRVTLIARGRTAFVGTVPELLAHAVPRRYLLRLRNGVSDAWALEAAGRRALGDLGALEPAGAGESEHFVLDLSDAVVLGDALAVLSSAGFSILTCREERSEIEEAFLSIAGAGSE